MDRLRISDEVFSNLTSSLSSARGDLDSAGDVSNGVADAVGHPALRDSLRQFADNWRIHRERLVASMDSLDSDIRGVADTFSSTDKKMGDSLHGSAAGGAGTGSPGVGATTTAAASGNGPTHGTAPAQTTHEAPAPAGNQPAPHDVQPIAAANDAPAAVVSDPTGTDPALGAASGDSPVAQPDLGGSGDALPVPEPVATDTPGGGITDGLGVAGTLGAVGAVGLAGAAGLAGLAGAAGSTAAATVGSAAGATTSATAAGGTTAAATVPGATVPGATAAGTATAGSTVPATGGGSGSASSASPAAAAADEALPPVPPLDLPPLPGAAGDGAGATGGDALVQGSVGGGSGGSPVQLPVDTTDHAAGPTSSHQANPMAGGAAMGGMAAMSAGAHGAAANQMRSDVSTTAQPQSRSDEERAKEARELLEKLRSEREDGEATR